MLHTEYTSVNMSYFEQSIKDVLVEIEDGKLFLPAIQRKFVWS